MSAKDEDRFLWTFSCDVLCTISTVKDLKASDIPGIIELFNDNLDKAQETNLVVFDTLALLKESEFIKEKIPDLLQKCIQIPLWGDSEKIYPKEILTFDIDYRSVCLKVIMCHFCQTEQDLKEISQDDFWPQIIDLGKDPELEGLVAEIYESVADLKQLIN